MHPAEANSSRAADEQEVTELSNAGVRFAQTERADLAETMLRRALLIAEQRLGEQHVSTAVCLSNLGDFLRQAQRFEEAEPLIRRAVALHERRHGPNHSETGTALNNLALLFRRSGRLQEAEPIYQQVLGIFEAAHGADSLNVAGVLNNLAQVLQHTDRGEQAEPLMRRAIAIFEQHFGPRHPHVAVTLNNLARLLDASARSAEAEPLMRRQLEIFQGFEDETGNQHMHKDSAIQGYWDLLLRLGLTQAQAQTRIDAVIAGREVGAIDVGSDASDFDALSRVANADHAQMSDKSALFCALFRLPEWHFIARGELPNLRPYVAANANIVDGAPMLKAFTDTEKLHAFARECGLCDADDAVSILALPVQNIMPLLSDYAEQGVWGIHFNADDGSDGFYAPLAQMPAIRRHLESQGLI